MNQWEVWYARFPFEEDVSITKERPVIILNVETLECLSVKVTSHEVRDEDEFDTPITHWREAGLKRPSIARISKTVSLTKDKFTNKKGTLHTDDQLVIMQRFTDFINSKSDKN